MQQKWSKYMVDYYPVFYGQRNYCCFLAKVTKSEVDCNLGARRRRDRISLIDHSYSTNTLGELGKREEREEREGEREERERKEERGRERRKEGERREKRGNVT